MQQPTLFEHDADDVPYKQCTGPCGQEYPATTEYWHRDKQKKDGLCPRCKACKHKYHEEHFIPAEKPYRPLEGYKLCTGPCGKEYPATTEYFYKTKKGKYGVDSCCKECHKQYGKERYSRDSERINNRNRTYRSRPEVKERHKLYGKEYRSRPETQEYAQLYRKEYYSKPEAKEHKKAHDRDYYRRPEIREEIISYQRIYRARPEIQEHHKLYRKAYHKRPEVQERTRAYKRAHRKAYFSRPGIRERYRAHNHNRRTRKMAARGTHTHDQIQDQLKRQRHKCYYCQARLKKTKGKYIYHIDHTFPLSRVVGTDIPANSIDYLVLTCPTCNLSKHDKFPWEYPEGGRLL